MNPGLLGSFAFVFAALVMQPGAAAQQNTAQPDSKSAIRATAQEVLLDIVVRDKKGRPVKDLEPNDIEITDDGVVQKLKSFRLVNINEPATGASPATPAGTGPRSAAALDPTREVRLVTLAFEHLGTDGRTLSRQAALDLLKNEGGPNLYFAVFMIDQRLSVLQQYTADKEAVRKAIGKATSASYSLYTDESNRIEQELKALTALNSAQSAQQITGQPTSSQMSSMSVAAMAQMTVNMLQFSQTMERTQAGRASIFSLMSLVKEQYRLPGRKTLVYFSEGLLINEFLVDQFKAVIGMANRANVSVYAVDAKGLVTYGQNSAAGHMLSEAVASSRSQQNNRPAPVTPDQVKALDLADDSTRSNGQNSLADLSESTGGFLIANTNDLRQPLRRVSEDTGTYYEASYTPQFDKFDGRFRRISIKVSRPDVRVQTRSGYYALPAIEGQYLMPYELPMLNALASTPLPKTIPFRSAALHFHNKAGGPETAVVIEVPLAGISFTEDKARQTYKTHLSVLAIVKNSGGGIVQKFSRDVPAQGRLDQLDAAKAGHFIYTQHVEIPPGRYTLETSVLDRANLAVSGKRQVLIVDQPAKGLALSSLALVRSLTPEDSSQSDPADPFQFTGGKVTPTLEDSIKPAPGTTLSLYFVIYPETGVSEEPTLTIEFLQDGVPVGRGEPKLPPADQSGQISYIANSPIQSLKPGQYEVRATVRQGAKIAQQKTFVTLE